MPDIVDSPLADIAAALRGGRVRALDLLAAAEAAHARWGAALGAYSLWALELARHAAQAADAAFAAGVSTGPLQGIPFSAKDLFGVTGLPTHAGSARRLPPAWEREGPLVACLRRQLAVLTGKTHMVEFAFGGTAANAHHGAPRNPWDPAGARSPGGSSSGAGVSLLEGSAYLALGTDTAGSVRIPAAATGNVGLKVTRGRWSAEGLVPLSHTYDTPGILVRSAADAAWCFGAVDAAWGDATALLAHIARDLSGVRIGLGEPALWQDCAPDIAALVQAALAKAEAAGARLVEHRMPAVAEGNAVFRAGGISGIELAGFLQAELPDWPEILDPVNRPVVARAATVPAAEYIARLRLLDRLALRAQAELASVDVLACPTLCHAPMRVDEITDDASHWAGNRELTRNTVFANFFGLCGITLPVGRDALGMPVGLQLVAAPRQEEALLAIACAIERTVGMPREILGRPPMLAE